MEKLIVSDYVLEHIDHSQERNYNEPRREEISNGGNNGPLIEEETFFDKLESNLLGQWVAKLFPLKDIPPRMPVNMVTAHGENFTPLNVITRLDPERERLAQFFNDYIETRIANKEGGISTPVVDYNWQQAQWLWDKNNGLDCMHFCCTNTIEGLNDEIPTALRQDSEHITPLRQAFEKAVGFTPKEPDISAATAFAEKLTQERREPPSSETRPL